MKTLWVRNITLLLLMLTASGLALALRPSQKIALENRAINLEDVVPRSFGEWQEEPQNSVQMVDPQQQQTIDKIYTQTLNRTYVNRNGYRIMLALAYGEDQRDSMQVHYPEICYPAQGFTLHEKQAGTLQTKSGPIPITRIVTSLGPRNEPVTYWTTVGDYVVRGSMEKKVAEMTYGLKGKIPDGLLIRLSSIDPNVDHAYEVQTGFADQMLASLKPPYRQRLSGLSVSQR